MKGSQLTYDAGNYRGKRLATTIRHNSPTDFSFAFVDPADGKDATRKAFRAVRSGDEWRVYYRDEDEGTTSRIGTMKELRPGTFEGEYDEGTSSFTLKIAKEDRP